ncbi:MAG: hypothetical protein GF410_08620 [Chitinivibrionales bacterium]|nr:hypothetical protein [Chitinivibrionales bacterium]
MNRALLTMVFIVAASAAQVGKSVVEKSTVAGNSRKKVSREVAYHDDGSTLKWKGYIDSESGKREGTWRFYNEEGVLVEKGKYDSGVKAGEWMSFSSDGDTLECVRYGADGDTLGCE